MEYVDQEPSSARRAICSASNVHHVKGAIGPEDRGDQRSLFWGFIYYKYSK